MAKDGAVDFYLDDYDYPQGVPIIVSDESSFTYQYVPWRGVTAETMQFYGVQTKVDFADEPVQTAYPYQGGAKKIRSRKDKQFHSVGPMSDATLFGMDKFSAGSSKTITITEGELDALSVHQILGYPAVSVRSASSAVADCARERDYLNSFERIYLAFDNDEPGRRAAHEVAKLFDFNKVYDVQMTQFKDANDYLSNSKGLDFKRLWFNAKRFLPEGIISSQAEFDSIIDGDQRKEGVSYPFSKLQEMTYGIRTGETVLVTALEGIGKTEIIRAIEYHLLTTTDSNIGIIHLEEGKARTLKGLAGYHLRTPVHLPDAPVDNDAVKQAIRELNANDRIHLYSHFGSDDPDVILDTIRFLVTVCGCRYVFLDHISMVVSGLNTDDERKTLDYISTQLAMMVESLDFALILVSHVNDEGQTRGSRNISKVADLWIHLNRNQQAETEEKRNLTHLTVMKNRFGARTGPSSTLSFDLNTFMITEVTGTEFKLPPVGGKE